MSAVEKPADWRFRYFALRLSETHGLDHAMTHLELDRMIGAGRAKGLVACEVEAGDAAFREMRFADSRRPTPGAPVLEVKRRVRPKTYGLTAFGRRLAVAFLADAGLVAQVRGYVAELARVADERSEREFQAARRHLKSTSVWRQALRMRETTEGLRERMDVRLAIAITDAGCPQTLDDLVLWGFRPERLQRDLGDAVQGGALVVVGKGLYDVPARAPDANALPPYLSERVLLVLALGQKSLQQMAEDLPADSAQQIAARCAGMVAAGTAARVAPGIYELTDAGRLRVVALLEKRKRVLAKRAQLMRLARIARLSKRMGLEGDHKPSNVKIVRRTW